MWERERERENYIFAATHTKAFDLVKRSIVVIIFAGNSFHHRSHVHYLLLIAAAFHFSTFFLAFSVQVGWRFCELFRAAAKLNGKRMYSLIVERPLELSYFFLLKQITRPVFKRSVLFLNRIKPKSKNKNLRFIKPQIGNEPKANSNKTKANWFWRVFGRLEIAGKRCET